MDEGQNPNSGNNSRQPIFTPTTTPEQSAGVGLQSPTSGITGVTPTNNHVNLNHPYFSNHPSQTFNNDVGDIVIRTTGEKSRFGFNKKPFIIGGIIFVVVMILIVGVMSLAYIFQSADEKAVSLIQSNYATLKDAETMTFDAAHDIVTFSELVSDDYDKLLRQNTAAVKNFQTKLLDIIAGGISEEAAAEFAQVQEIVTSFSTAYDETLQLYTDIKDAYNSTNIEYFAELAKSENPEIKAIGNRFYDFFNEKNYWQKQIDSDDCKNNADSVLCRAAKAAHERLVNSLDDDTTIARMLFSAYSLKDYKFGSLSTDLQQIIQEIQDAA